MRDELRDVSEEDYLEYGFRLSDFDYTIHLLKSYEKDMNAGNQLKKSKILEKDPNISIEFIKEIDQNNWMKILYLWQFGLWRLQAILEGMIMNRFLPSHQPLFGLRNKLNAMKKSGFKISEIEFSELCQWARLRNALSHAPPEQFRPGPLRFDDLREYCSLVKKLCRRWDSQYN